MLIKEKIDLWRDLFYGRQEVFAIKETFFNQKENRTIVQYNPVLRDKTNKTGETAEEKFLPLTDNYIENHIKGYMELMIYMLHVDRTLRFAAIDFDKGHSFEDVLKCKSIIAGSHGIPCYVARSTKKGYHLYLFFDKPIEAKFVTSYINQVYTEIGWMAECHNDGRALPETFPKTIALRNSTSTGYGIKPPMWGKGLLEDRNCWVNDQDKPLGTEDEQWDFMQSIRKIEVEGFLSFIEKSGFPVAEVRISEKRGAVAQSDYKRTTPYVAPTDGDLNRVVQGCNAMKRMWEGNQAEMPHHGHVAILSWALQTSNGLGVIRERWNNSPQCEQQIRYAIETCQQPWTCKAMQEHGLCLKGKDPRFASEEGKPTDACFKKSPPKEMVNGKLEINPSNLPETDWADPSPVRLRVEIKRLDPDEIKKEIDELDKEDPEIGDKITKLYSKIVLIRETKVRQSLEKHLKARKLAKVSDLREIAREARDSNKEASMDAIHSDVNVIEELGVFYTRIQPKGYGIRTLDEEGNEITTPLCNFEVEFEKSTTRHTMIHGDASELKGHILTVERRIPFVLSAEDIYSNMKLARVFGIYGKNLCLFESSRLDKIRIAMMRFGSRNMTEEHRYEDYGWDCYDKPTVYRSGKWNITAHGFACDENSIVDMAGSEYARHLSIEKISNDEFTKLIHHIKNDLLPFQDSIITYTTLAHTLQSAIQMAFLPFKKSPILWIQGLTGTGKSAIAEILQNFHGNFPRVLNIQGTHRGLEGYAMSFKDSMLVLDDYKDQQHRDMMIKFIQPAYDRSARARLNKDLSQAVTPYNRGSLMVSAEDRPSSEASTLARCIIIECEQSKEDERVTDKRYKNLLGMKHLFSGVMGRFIHFMLASYGEAIDELAKKYLDYEALLKEEIRGAQNSHRIAQNLAANYLTWELFTEFLLQENMITQKEQGEYQEKHWQHVLRLRNRAVTLCGQEQASNVFIECLKEVIMSGSAKVEGMANTNDHASTVGFIDDPKAGIVYIIPGVAVGLVRHLLREKGSGMSHSQDSVGKQLVQDGVIRVKDPNRTTIRRTYRGQRHVVWAFDSVKSELGPMLRDENHEVSTNNVQEVTQDNIVPVRKGMVNLNSI
jgi:hypothetical protein